MAIEIERKFLAHPAVLEHCRSGVDIVQGYLFTDAENTVRVRCLGERYFLAWKGRRQGPSRREVEREIEPGTGAAMLAMIPARSRVEKTRHRIAAHGHVWEVDLFGGALSGLILAEVELGHADEPVVLPNWVGREVTADERYRNSRLAAYALRSPPIADRRRALHPRAQRTPDSPISASVRPRRAWRLR
ncbi:CYTH domain-containing protein [Methylobacterium sp. J-078]|uniref:CYTH domain-containing protein n=1 Tax=Methylobacterium sp. J-078 TaxID=2836657 RepID=UPI001FBB13A4|nr:CYTH domain-containing protein [Methylobacterium sp. J-078]MCJ2046689.1 CYTH domain-containing protein [Methylobacterium sp. J-078]